MEMSEGENNPSAVEFSPEEKLIDLVDGQGKYQQILCIINLALWFCASWIILGLPLFFNAEYSCIDIEDKTQCDKFICALPDIERSKYMQVSNSIVFGLQENLICQNDFLIPLLQSLFFLGSLIGFLTVASIADRFGRILAIQIAWGAFTVGVLLMLVAKSGWMLGIAIFLEGYGSFPGTASSFSIIQESCLNQTRERYILFLQLFLGIGECVIGILFIPGVDWRYIIVLLFFLCVIVQISLSFLIQSPKFTLPYSAEQTHKNLNRIAEYNNKPPISLTQVDQVHKKHVEHTLSNEKANILDLCRYPSIRISAICLSVILFTLQIGYYGTSFNLTNIGESLIINQVIIGVSESFGIILTTFFIHYVKRKSAIICGMLVFSGVCLLLTLFSSLDQGSKRFEVEELILLMLNRCFLAGSWAVVIVFSNQLFPTRLRSLGIGLCNAIGILGSASASYIIFQSQKLGVNSWVALVAFGVVGALSIIKTKETYMNPTIQEIEQLTI